MEKGRDGYFCHTRDIMALQNLMVKEIIKDI